MLKNIFLCLTLVLANPIFADEGKPKTQSTEEDLKKNEVKKKEEKKEEERVETGDSEENPLPKIVDLMKEIESRLNDSQDGTDVEDKQKKIVEAMKFGSKATTALDDLIKKLEDQMTKSSQTQSSSKNQPQSKSQSKPETPEQKAAREQRDRSKMEREKKDEEKRKAANPGPNKKEDASTKVANNSKEKAGKSDDKAQFGNDPKGVAGQWGSLPAKLHSDAVKARDSVVPERWREKIDKYREAVAK